MESKSFCYWLQGFFEIEGVKAMTEEQVRMVSRHLSLVFKHEIDPALNGDPAELQAIHDGASQAGLFNRPPGVRC